MIAQSRPSLAIWALRAALFVGLFELGRGLARLSRGDAFWPDIPLPAAELCCTMTASLSRCSSDPEIKELAMTPSPDTADTEDRSEAQPRSQLLKWIGLFVLLSFALGFTAAGVVSAIEHPDEPLNWIAAGLGLVAMTIAFFLAHRLYRQHNSQPLSEAEKGRNKLIIVSTGLGAALGLTVMAGTDLAGGDFSLFSNAPMPATIAIIGIVGWLIMMPWITIAWLRTVDEHARETYNFGALVAFHLYALIVPAWWIGWRGGFLPEPEQMLIYLGAMFVWCAAWLWRQYR